MIEYGLQLYSVRDVARNLPTVLKKVYDIGYRTVEFAGFYDYEPAFIKDCLDSIGLRAVGTHTSLSLLTEDKIEKTAELHLAIGVKHLTVPSGNWSTKENFVKNIEILNFANEALKSYGIELGYHNHSSEFFKTPYGIVVEDEIIKQTDVNIELDTFWAYNADINSLGFMETHRERIKLIHLKDGFARSPIGACFENASRGAIGKSLGLGNAPIVEVRNFALKNKIHMIVESEDLAPTGLIEVERCMEYLRSLE